MRVAITRDVASSIVRCELTEIAREPIDVARARAQHAVYCDVLRTHGWDVAELPVLEDHPDSVFVEDCAVVFDEIALMMRPGAESRRGEVESVASVLGEHRELRWIEAPGCVDGGDVIVQGRRVWVGRTTRSNEAAIAQMRERLEEFGYEVRGVEVRGCLHLKSAATAFGESRVVTNPEWVDVRVFEGCEVIETPAGESGGANVVDLGDCVLVASRFPGVAQRVRDAGLEVELVEADELAKAEGALTCCSVLVG
ncbi:MAG: dimethylarginine dimethylaminohydrolase family protein [Phycisphaerales bacterium JB043]